MKRLTIYLLFAATICTASSFAPANISVKKEVTKEGDSKFYYSEVQTLDKGYYFTNVIEAEAGEYGSTYENMMKFMKSFRAKLKSEYDLDWPLSNITAHEWKTRESAQTDRKKRIGYAGEDVKYIDL